MNTFGMVHRVILEDERIGGNAIRLYGYLASFADKKSGECFPSWARISSELPLNKDTISTARKQLERYGYVVIRREKGSGGRFGRNVYILPLIRGELPVPLNSEMEKPEPENAETIKPELKDSDYNIPYITDQINQTTYSTEKSLSYPPRSSPHGKQHKKRSSRRKRQRDRYRSDPESYEPWDPNINPFEDWEKNEECYEYDDSNPFEEYAEIN